MTLFLLTDVIITKNTTKIKANNRHKLNSLITNNSWT